MRGLQQNQWSRIDYFLISVSLAQNCTGCDILPSVLSDHSMVFLTLESVEHKHGPGTWKFNNELLEDDTFCENMSHIIQGVVRTYSYLNPCELWEIVKY